MKNLKQYYQFVEKHFQEKGTDFCKEQLNLTNMQVRYITRKLNLKTDVKPFNFRRGKKFPKLPCEYQVNYEEFCKIDTPLKSYLHGLLWADGHVTKKRDVVMLSSTYPDADSFLPYFKQTGHWNVYSYSKRGRNWKRGVNIQTNNFFISENLKKYNYADKKLGASKIVSTIPKSLQHYWFRGLSDGDGCFYLHKKKGLYKFSVAAQIEQDWEFILPILDELKIKYNIEKTCSKRGNYSKLIISGKSRVKNFGDFIYKDYEIDNIGLVRKWEKYKEISSMCNKWVMSDAQ